MRRPGAVAPSVHLALIAVQVMFATWGVAGKLVMRELSPFGVIAFRVPMAALLLWVIRRMYPWRPVDPRDLPELALYAVLGIAANQLLFASGLYLTSATNAAVLSATIPVFAVGVALLFGRERLTGIKLAGIALALGGALSVAGGGFALSGDHALGDLLIIANSLCYASYLVISGRLFARYDALAALTWVMTFGALFVLPFGIVDLIAAAPTLSPEAWIELVYIVLIPTVGAYFLNAHALARAPSSLVAIYVYVQPIAGALMAAAALGERPAGTTALGAVCVCAGIWLVTRDARRARISAAGGSAGPAAAT